MLNQILTKVVLLLILLAASPAIAHENHDELGAGPGPATEANVADGPAKPRVEATPTPQPTAGIHGNMAAAHGQAMEHHAEAEERTKTFGQRMMSWLGRTHSLFVHFPIAMFVGAMGVELFGLWRRRDDYEWAAQVMLGVGAIGAVAAAFLGWFAGGFYWTDRNPILMIHRWLGTGIAIAGLILLYLSSKAKRTPEKPRTLYWGLLGAMTIAIAIQGWLGGSFMHGGIHHMDF